MFLLETTVTLAGLRALLARPIRTAILRHLAQPAVLVILLRRVGQALARLALLEPPIWIIWQIRHAHFALLDQMQQVVQLHVQSVNRALLTPIHLQARHANLAMRLISMFRKIQRCHAQTYLLLARVVLIQTIHLFLVRQADAEAQIVRRLTI